MNSVLLFVCALAALVVLAIVVNRVTGVRASYLEDFAPDAGEVILAQDKAADFHTITVRGGGAVIRQFARMRRTHAVVTNQRVVIGTRVLFGRRHLITHMLYYSAREAPAAALNRVDGGQWSLGNHVGQVDGKYMTVEIDGSKAFIRLLPDATRSVLNIEHYRLYCDDAAGILRSLGEAGVI